MVAAHGGLDRWRAAPTISYDNVFFNPAAPPGPSAWWVSRETIHQATRRVVQRWQVDEATLAWDGEKVWTVGWKRANPPAFMALFFYYFQNIPWLTQDPTAQIGASGAADLPGHAGVFDTVRVTFGAPHPVGRTATDFFVLYVERETGLMRAYQYGIGYGAMLDLMGVPPERDVFGPMLRIVDAFTEVDGLVFPSVMHTGNLDGSSVYGHHTLFNYSITDPWDDAWVVMPPDAVVDRSSARRQATSAP